LRKLADQGRTIILITHATKNVMMCDKVIFLARRAPPVLDPLGAQSQDLEGFWAIPRQPDWHLNAQPV
jgi:ABC-type Mn2+/Zn2+ transport system ATPase subunit